MAAEERLRELLHDPRWSLPAWTPAELQARVARSAARQRRRLARISAAVAVTVTTAAALPALALTGPPGSPGGPGAARQELSLPAVGAAGFSVTVYPAARVPAQATVVTPLCPARAGLQTPGRATALVAVQLLRTRAASFTTALHQADRSYWGRLRRSWQRGYTTIVPQVTVQKVVYSGPLASFHGRAGPAGLAGKAAPAAAAGPGWAPVPAGRAEPDAAAALVLAARPVAAAPARAQLPAAGRARPVAGRARPPAIASIVAAGCGRAIVRDTWLVVSGTAQVPQPGRPPAREVATLFLKRQGHVLLYTSL